MYNANLTSIILEVFETRSGLTVAELHKVLVQQGHSPSTDSLSSILYRLTKRNILVREKSGPRGGYGYWKKQAADKLTPWQLLRSEVW